MIKTGSRWTDSNGKFYHIINRVEINGKTWVYYKSENAKENENSEFSCYEESFLARFTPHVNN
jgi:hypothetical protein